MGPSECDSQVRLHALASSCLAVVILVIITSAMAISKIAWALAPQSSFQQKLLVHPLIFSFDGQLRKLGDEGKFLTIDTGTQEEIANFLEKELLQAKQLPHRLTSIRDVYLSEYIHSARDISDEQILAALAQAIQLFREGKLQLRLIAGGAMPMCEATPWGFHEFPSPIPVVIRCLDGHMYMRKEFFDDFAPKPVANSTVFLEAFVLGLFQDSRIGDSLGIQVEDRFSFALLMTKIVGALDMERPKPPGSVFRLPEKTKTKKDSFVMIETPWGVRPARVMNIKSTKYREKYANWLLPFYPSNVLVESVFAQKSYEAQWVRERAIGELFRRQDVDAMYGLVVHLASAYQQEEDVGYLYSLIQDLSQDAFLKSINVLPDNTGSTSKEKSKHEGFIFKVGEKLAQNLYMLLSLGWQASHPITPTTSTYYDLFEHLVNAGEIKAHTIVNLGMTASKSIQARELIDVMAMIYHWHLQYPPETTAILSLVNGMPRYAFNASAQNVDINSLTESIREVEQRITAFKESVPNVKDVSSELDTILTELAISVNALKNVMDRYQLMLTRNPEATIADMTPEHQTLVEPFDRLLNRLSDTVGPILQQLARGEIGSESGLVHGLQQKINENDSVSTAL